MQGGHNPEVASRLGQDERPLLQGLPRGGSLQSAAFGLAVVASCKPLEDLAAFEPV